MTINPLEFIRFLTFKRADTCEQIDAQSLFREVYSQDIKYVPADPFDDRAAYLIARTDEGRIVASLRFLGPEFRPFEIEDFCDLSKYLSTDRCPALVGRLSVRREYRKVPGSILLHFGLLKLAIAYGKQHGVTDLFLYTLPHLLNFYRSAFFIPVGCVFEYRALGAQMHIMRLDIDDLDRKCQQADSGRAQFLLAKDAPNFIV